MKKCDDRTDKRTERTAEVLYTYPNLFLAEVYKSYQKLTLKIKKKIYISFKSTFDPFS